MMASCRSLFVRSKICGTKYAMWHDAVTVRVSQTGILVAGVESHTYVMFWWEQSIFIISIIFSIISLCILNSEPCEFEVSGWG